MHRLRQDEMLRRLRQIQWCLYLILFALGMIYGKLYFG
jgi:hypothetical protein